MRNLITDVPGIAVGNAGDGRLLSGVTVILPDAPACAAVSIMGGGPGTRETALLDPSCTVDRVDAVVLAGGSAFGLDAAGGVTDRLHRLGRGFKVGNAVVPIVPAAILFDLLNRGDKDWGEEPPYRALGRAAFDLAAGAAAGHGFALGNAGAGLGARAGGLKGGLGSASARTAEGYTVGAIVAVNCFGSVTIPGTASFWAAPFERDGEFGGLGMPARLPELPPEFVAEKKMWVANTTLALVATDATLDKMALQRIAIMAQDGLARAIRPLHTPQDGDTVFALSTLRRPAPANAAMRIGALAGDVLARAVARGVWEAASVAGWPSYQEVHAAALARGAGAAPQSRRGRRHAGAPKRGKTR